MGHANSNNNQGLVFKRLVNSPHYPGRVLLNIHRC